MARRRSNLKKMKMTELINTSSSSNVTCVDALAGQESVIDQDIFDFPLEDDNYSSVDTWQVVERKEKYRSKKTLKPRKKASSKSRHAHDRTSQNNQTKITYGLPDKCDVPYDLKEESDSEESLEFSFSEECAYCQIGDTNCIIQCGNCKKWFCNTTTKSGSHIIWHFTRSGHNEVILHRNAFPECDILKLGCFHCQHHNVFDLGFVMNEAESYNVLLCRLPCGVQKKSGLNGVDLGLCDWQPIIKDRYLLSWLAEKKSAQFHLQKSLVSASQMDKLEEMWKNEPYATFDDLKLERYNETTSENTKLRYKSADEFERIFSNLVRLEEDHDEMQSKIQIQDNTTIRWDKLRTKGFIAFVAYFVIENPLGEVNLSLNKELRLRHRGNDSHEYWSRVGHIVKTPKHSKDEIGVLFRINKKLTEYTSNFIIENVFNSSGYARMYNALEEFALNEESLSKYIYETLLGRKVESEFLIDRFPKQLSVQGLPKLNHSQKYAIKQALRRPLCLIQGPPGTGKTVTSASLIYHLVKQENGTVLVCAPSNTAVDNLAEKIHKTGLNVVRLFAKSREDTDSPVLFLGLHVRICEMDGWNDIPELIKLHREKQIIGELSPCDEKRYNYLKWPFEKRLLSAADVICCTCVTAGDRRMNAFQFHSILIDECTQATEPEYLIPLIRGAQQVTLVGDHCQLGPVIMSRQANEAGLSTSLFERLLALGNYLVKLEVQYRMHPSLSRFSSIFFYNDLLKNGVNADSHKIQNTRLECLWPNAGTPMLFYAAETGQEELATSGTSFLNQTEAILVEQFIAHLLSLGVRPDQIGIITPYQGQRAFLSQYLEFSVVPNHNLYQQIEVASVDIFQGREKDLIIFSCVRSNDQNNIGFLRDARRLNVAITRARYGLIVIGNPKVLTKNPLWNQLLIHFDQNKALVEGPITCLRKCCVKLNQPSNMKSFMKLKTFNAKEYFHK